MGNRVDECGLFASGLGHGAVVGMF